eukprot:2612806-Pyramimonas_sp.AAC.1
MQNGEKGMLHLVLNTTGQCECAGSNVGAHRGPEELSRTPEPLAPSSDCYTRQRNSWNDTGGYAVVCTKGGDPP